MRFASLVLLASLTLACDTQQDEGNFDRIKIMISEAPAGIQVRLYSDVTHTEPALRTYDVYVTPSGGAEQAEPGELDGAVWADPLVWTPGADPGGTSDGGETSGGFSEWASVTLNGQEFNFYRIFDHRYVNVADALEDFSCDPEWEDLCEWSE